MSEKSKSRFFTVAFLVLATLGVHAAPVTWGSVQSITEPNNIISTGVTSLAGANFGLTTGTTLTVNNGTVNINFASLNSGQSALLANGITVAADANWINFGNNNGNSSMTGTYGQVLDRNLGLEPPDSPATATITLSGLTNGTQYQIQFFADSTGNNGQTISGSGTMNSGPGQYVVGTFTADGSSQVLSVTTTSGGFGVANALTIGIVGGGGSDVTPPVWTATWPQSDPLSTTSITVRAQTNETGKAYYVVLPDGATTPSAAQVKAGTNSTGTQVSASGSMVLTASFEATAPVGSLSPGTAYDVYFVAEDAVPNLQVSPVLVDVTTLTPDTTPPVWTATWPQAEPLSPTSLTVRARTNETGAAYYVVLASGAPAPSAAQVKAFTDSNNTPVSASGNLALTANIETTAPVTGLTRATTYDVYFVAEDAVPNLQAAPSPVSVSLANAGVIIWGSVQTITGASNIISTGVTSLAGADFGIPTGTTTTVNNGSVDIEFKSLRSGQSAALSNGITVAAAADWINFGANGGISSLGGTFGAILDRNLGVEPPDSPATATITLTGLANGTQYQIQAFVDSTASNGQNISGSATMNSLPGQFVVGTFTADGTSQVLSVTTTSGGFGVINALTIGQTGASGNSPEIALEGLSSTNIPNGGLQDFGTVTTGSSSDLVFTIRNTGNANLNLTGSPVLVGVTGTNPGDFTVTSPPAANPIPAGGGATTFTVRFAPGAIGARTAQLSIANNDGNENPFIVTLNGTGQSPSGSPPVANDDAITLNPGGTAGLAVLANDTNGPLNPLSVTVTSGPSPGSTALPQPDGRILYTHGGGAGATDSFTYTVRGQNGTTSNAATVAITIDPSLRLENTTSTLPDTAPPVTLSVVDAFPGLLFEDVLAMRSPPGNTTQLFLAERRGKISYVPDVTSATPERRVLIDVGTIPGFAFDDTAEGELGLLSFAFHPDFTSNGYFYVFYTATGGNPYFDRVSRFQVALDGGRAPILNNPTASIATELRLFSEFDQVDNHNAGDIHFGPDGYLYIAMGDEGNQKNASRNAQLIDKDLFSAILRIDVDKKSGNIEPNLDDAIPTDGGIARFSIPIDNPFVHTSFGGLWNGTFNGSAIPDLSKVQRSFWAVGFRSPWRMSFDTLTGDLYVGDVGQENYEEVSLVERGKNYGWAFREGFQQTPGTPSANIGVPPPGFTPADPLYDYSHGSGNFQGNSVTCGVVYRGTAIPSLTGKYIFGDFVSGHVWSLERTAGAPVLQRLATDAGIAAFGIDPSNGDVLICNYLENKVKRLVAGMVLDDDFPQTLTETGIFADLATLTPNPGILAYEPAVSFWSDHAIKKRWFSIPDPADRIGFSMDTPWSFPQGMFWVKHFDMEMVRGNPASTKRIETRVLMKTATASYGMSYKWNAAGTEATLVEDAGGTFNLSILDGGTPINQTYQIPSRGACFSCHTPVAGHALSFNTRQLNHDDQIVTLGSAGYFDAPLPSLAFTPAFVPLTDTSVSREFRVRSYLAVNCVSCHQPGGSSPGTWDARPNVPLEQSGLILGSAARPLNPGDLLVAPGDSIHSILLQRVKAGNGYTRMPPLGSHVLDSEAIQLLQDWIEFDLPGYQTYDQWAAGWFGPGAGAIAERGTDADGDGRNNEFERLTGSNPRNGGNFWTMDLTVSGGNVLLNFPTPANAAILIESSPDLLHWTPWMVPGNEPFFPAAAGTRQLAAPFSEMGPSHFFRGTAVEP